MIKWLWFKDCYIKKGLTFIEKVENDRIKGKGHLVPLSQGLEYLIDRSFDFAIIHIGKGEFFLF